MTTIERTGPDLEERLADLDARLRTVEARTETRAATRAAQAARVGAFPAPATQRAPKRAPEPAPAPVRPSPPSAPPAPSPAPHPTRPPVDLERLLGGQVLAWVGAVAVLAGLVLLFALGVSEGWIDPGARVLLGAGLSALLVGAGAWLHERRGRTQAAQAAAAAGSGGLFLAVTVASRGYDLVAPELGLILAAAVALLTAVLAIRWDSQVVGALGVAGALLAPVLADVPFGGASALFVLVAAAAATFVVLYERWTWLSFAVIVLPAAQWAPALLTDGWSVPGTVALLAGFGVVGAAAALGVELRTRTLQVRTPAAYLLGLNAILLALVGAFALVDVAGRDAAALWLLGLAGAHAAAGFAVRGRARELTLLAYALATLVANVALSVADLDDTVRTVVWAGSAVGIAGLTRLRRTLPDALVACGLGGQLALATMSTLLEVRQDGPEGAGLVIALGALAAGCLISGRLTGEHRDWRLALDGAGLVAVAVLGAVATGGVALTLTWAALAAGLGTLARQTHDRLTAGAALLFLGGALAWCLTDQAPLTALLDGDLSLGPAALGLGAVLAAAGALLRPGVLPAQERRLLTAATSVLGLYLASLVVVAIAPAAPAADPSPFSSGDDLRVGNAAQLALSALWALVGVGALVVGLRLHRRPVRVAALALLGVTVAKVFLFDLSTLTSLARVGSFLALGVLLLLAAFAYQRLRPEPIEGTEAS